MNSKPVKIVETVLRDGHQSLEATRMRTSDMVPALEKLDNVGYYALEAWGGATFDACLRYLDEDPWERLRTIRKYVHKTKLQMLLRGQNILGYNHYADDVVQEFVFKSVENGIDIIRIFDALNDVRNLECAIRATKEAGAHAQAALVYTVSPYHKDSDYVKLAQDVIAMGADSICIKDMAGLLRPYAAFHLVKSLKTQTSVPIEVHSHCSSGMASTMYLKAIEAGVDIIDTALTPFSRSTSQPCTESMVAMLENQERDTGLDLKKLHPLSDYFLTVKRSVAAEFNLNTDIQIDPKVLTYQIPGGMLTNLMKQLKDQGAADKLAALFTEMPLVRADLGYPPLVTPTSQIVGSQAAMNVILGRYKMIPTQVKDLVRGKYGKTPGPINPIIKKLVLGDNEPITHRPADDIPPQMTQMRTDLTAAGFPTASTEDVLSYALFPEIALPFFKKHR